MGRKAYTKKFLISELHRFVEENGRNPRQIDIQCKFGYPSYVSYQNHFGTWNNALIKAGLEINKINDTTQNGTEVCDNCGTLKTSQWYYKDGWMLCPSCYNNPDYKNGNLDYNSTVGFAFLSQRVAAKTLGLDLEYDCNCSQGFKAPYDLYDEKLGYINIKASVLLLNNIWKFGFKNEHIPDTYILLGFAGDKSDILHVWITDPLDDLTYEKKTITITDDIFSGLKRAKPWEVDVEPYNDAYHNMSLENCSVLKKE